MEDGNADGRRGVFAPWILALGLVVLFGCQQALSPTPSLYLQGDRDWFADVPWELQTSTVDWRRVSGNGATLSGRTMGCRERFPTLTLAWC